MGAPDATAVRPSVRSAAFLFIRSSGRVDLLVEVKKPKLIHSLSENVICTVQQDGRKLIQ